MQNPRNCQRRLTLCNETRLELFSSLGCCTRKTSEMSSASSASKLRALSSIRSILDIMGQLRLSRALSPPAIAAESMSRILCGRHALCVTGQENLPHTLCVYKLAGKMFHKVLPSGSAKKIQTCLSCLQKTFTLLGCRGSVTVFFPFVVSFGM